eukprot:1644041-Karenia_brevis.AAC.1
MSSVDAYTSIPNHALLAIHFERGRLDNVVPSAKQAKDVRTQPFASEPMDYHIFQTTHEATCP